MATIDTTCPVCAAPHARKLSLIYEEGRTSMSSTIQTVGKTNTIGQIKITTQGTSYGVQQSDASAAAAPPPIPPLFSDAKMMQNLFIYGSWVVAVVVALVIASNDGGFLQGLGIAFAIMMAGLVIGLMCGDEATEEEKAAHRKKHSEAYAAVENWAGTFSCGSCGHRFIPEGLAKSELVAEAAIQPV